MITIEPHHYKIVMDILTKYPYSFYAYGSRTIRSRFMFNDPDSTPSYKRHQRRILYLKTAMHRRSYRCSLEFQACIKNDLVQLPCELAPPTTLPI